MALSFDCKLSPSPLLLEGGRTRKGRADHLPTGFRALGL